MAEEIQRVRGCAMNPARADKIDQTAQKVAQLLAESKATFADVDLIFSRSKLYIVSEKTIADDVETAAISSGTANR